MTSDVHRLWLNFIIFHPPEFEMWNDSEVPILPPKTLGGVPHNQHLQTSSAPAEEFVDPELEATKTQWKTNGQNGLVLEIVWDNENPSCLGDWHYPMELDARSSNFSAIHFNDKSESRVLSKAPKLVETRNRDDTRNRNLCLSPEILSKGLVTSTMTFPTNLCEIYVKMKSSFTFNGNTEIWSNRSPFWGENGVTFFWSFCFFHIRNPLQSVLISQQFIFGQKKRSVFFFLVRLLRGCNQQPESNSALSIRVFCRNFTALCPQRCSDVSRHLAYKGKEEGTALFVA